MQNVSKNLEKGFFFEEIHEYVYFIGHMKVVTDIFDATKYKSVAVKLTNEVGSINLFLATDDLDLATFDTLLIERQGGKGLIKAAMCFDILLSTHCGGVLCRHLKKLNTDLQNFCVDKMLYLCIY